MHTFNPFAFFYYASDAELDKAVWYLRDCLDRLDTQEWEVRGTPPSRAEMREAESAGHPLKRWRRRTQGR